MNFVAILPTLKRSGPVSEAALTRCFSIERSIGNKTHQPSFVEMFQLFQEMRVLLKEHEELIKEFAGFLDPEQAMACGYLKDQQQFFRARLFLRKLEVRTHFTNFASFSFSALLVLTRGQ